MISLGNVFLLGDSYSTFAGFIPEEYDTYYSTKLREETDVVSVKQTWWHLLLSKTDSVLLKNCSYSGTTICNTGYDGMDCSNISFMARFDKLAAEGYFEKNKIDTFFLFGGTNDSWADSPLGQLMYSDWKKEDLFSILPSFCRLIHNIHTQLPDTNVICILNTALKPEIKSAFVKVCKKYDIDTLQLESFDLKCGHPTVKGMAQIKDQILNHLEQQI